MSQPIVSSTYDDSKEPFPHPLFFLSLATILLCGGYAFGLFPFMTPLYSAGVLLIEGVIISFSCYRETRKENLDLLEIIIHIASIVFILSLTLITTICHIWWPRTMGGVGAGITLLITVYIVIDDLSCTPNKYQITN